MKIVNASKTFELFESLDFGDVFQYDGFTYMKVRDFTDEDCDEYDCYNAINLMDGEFMSIDELTDVLVVDAVLTVK